MNIFYTKKVLEELRDIFKASPLDPTVTISDLKAVSELTDDITIDISLESVLYDMDKSSPGRSGYLRNFLINVSVGVDCQESPLKIYDVIDELEGSIFKDSELWKNLIDRDIVSVAYDHNKNPPFRGATILMEVKTRLVCAS